MNEKTTEKNSTKKVQIVKTGDVLFSTYGVKRVTVEEICREAGVSKVTFYKYFPNKLELFKHIWTGWSDDIFERLLDLERSGASFMEQMQAIVEFKMELLAKMSPQIIEDVLHSGPELTEFIRELRARSMTRFFTFVEKARKSGEMRDIKTEFLLATLDCLTRLAENDDLRRLYPTDLDFFRELNDFFFFGIMPAGSGTEDGK
jgi:AcrR family transcriptional regulator